MLVRFNLIIGAMAMRSAAFQDCLRVFRKFGIDPSRGSAVDVGGTEVVWLDGVPAPNPLKRLNPNLLFLDKGFNVEALGTSADYVVDFLDSATVSSLQCKFDIVFCFDTLEHIPNPFLFCENLIYITKNGGYVYVATVFEWPYHPSPEDYFRFSPSGLRECFTGPANRLREEFLVLCCDWCSDGKGVFLLGQRVSNQRSK